MNKIQTRISSLLKQHKTYRAIGDAIGVDHTVLYKLHAGKLTGATDSTLAKLGLVKRVTFHDVPAQFFGEVVNKRKDQLDARIEDGRRLLTLLRGKKP